MPPDAVAEPAYMRPPIPEPEYQGGELSHYEDAAEHGFYERETERQGSPQPHPHPPLPPHPHPPLPPPHAFATPEKVFTSGSYPVIPPWNFYPYYYDYQLLTGQYPPGTYTHVSTNFEHGRDAWQDVHYLKEDVPYNPEPVQESVAFQLRKVPTVHTGQ